MKVFVRETGRNANSTDRQTIKAGTDDMMENGMIKFVPLMEHNEFLDSDTQLGVVGNEVQLDGRKCT